MMNDVKPRHTGTSPAGPAGPAHRQSTVDDRRLELALALALLQLDSTYCTVYVLFYPNP